MKQKKKKKALDMFYCNIETFQGVFDFFIYFYE